VEQKEVLTNFKVASSNNNNNKHRSNISVNHKSQAKDKDRRDNKHTNTYSPCSTQ